MATKTLTSFDRTLTEAEIVTINNYVSAEMTAGNTDGVNTQVYRTGVSYSLLEREWSNSGAANAFITFVTTSFTPAPVYAVTLS
jgi:hypothetical protein